MLELSTILSLIIGISTIVGLFILYRAIIITKHKKKIHEKIPQNEQQFYWQKNAGQLDSSNIIELISTDVIESSEQAFIIKEDFLDIAQNYINKKYKGAFTLVISEHFPDEENLLGYQELNQTELEREEKDKDVSFTSPAATLASCGLREYKLLMNNHTDISSSLKNLTIDFFSSSGVTMAATQLGSRLGRFAGPVGAMVGGMIGGALGALGSKLKINKYKYQELNNAIAEYQEQAENGQTTTRAAMQEQIEIMIETTATINKQFNDEVNKLYEKYRTTMINNYEQWNNLMTELIHKFGQHNQEIIMGLQALEVELLSVTSKSNLLIAFIKPSEDDIFRKEVSKWFNKRYKECNRNIEKLVDNQQQVFHYYRKHATTNASVIDLLEKLSLLDPVQLEQNVLDEVDKIAEKSEQMIHEAVTTSINVIEEVISEQATLVYEKKQIVKAEARKLGKDI